MLPSTGRLATEIWSFNAIVVSLLLGLALGTPPLLSAQSAAPLEEIHSLLKNHRKLAQEHGSILVAEITKMEAIRRSACKSGIEHRVTYRVVENLRVEPDSPIEPGYVITEGFVDCGKKQLPSPPFAVGVKVLLYCGRLERYNCLPPTSNKTDNSERLDAWLDALRHDEGDPALLQVHESLLESSEILSKVPTGRPVVIKGELGWPFLFTGRIKSIEPHPQGPLAPISVLPRRYLEISVSKILWGKPQQLDLRAWCNSPKCGGAQPNENVILHCHTTLSFAECSPPAAASQEILDKVESWTTQLGNSAY
jgi:hypothetical protein